MAIRSKSLNTRINEYIHNARETYTTFAHARNVYLMTDFGNADLSVMPMSGVIQRISRNATCIIAPQLPAFEIQTAAFLLEVNHPAYFQDGSIFCVVVDPGVGTDRLPVAIKAGGKYYVGPNNGIFSRIVTKQTFERAVVLDNDIYYLHDDISDVFHGRDIFAAIAGHLSAGAPLEILGTEISFDDLYVQEGWVKDTNKLTGAVTLVDDFGSLITDISKDDFTSFTEGYNFEIEISLLNSGEAVDHCLVSRVVQTFDGGNDGELIALFVGDFISLEGYSFMTIAVNMGNAKERTKAQIGDVVSIVLK